MIGSRFRHLIEAWDHWIAFVLLAGIGGKMVLEAVRGRGADAPSDSDRAFDWGPLLVLAVATSIDALAAGLTLPLLGIPLVIAVAVIGVVTALLSFAGVWLGRRFGARVGKKLDGLGGLLLIGLGVKILVQHLTA